MSHKKRTAKAAPVKVQISKKMEVKDNSPYVFQRDKINFDLIVRDLPWTQKQKDIIEQIDYDNHLMIITGSVLALCLLSVFGIYSQIY